MGRTIIAEEYLENNLLTLFNKNKCVIGVILGQITEQRDYVLHLATTPKAEPGGGQGDQKVKVTKQDTLDTVDESWIATHAKQVIRMLPGGLDVLGIFAVSEPDAMKMAQAKLRQVLFAVYKYIGISDTPSTERVILQICSLSRKITCRTFDVSDPKSVVRPADWKYQRFSDKIHRLETSLAVHSFIPVHNTSLSQSLEKQILGGIQPFCDNVRNSIATIDHQMAAGGEQLVPSQTSTGKKSKKQPDEATGKNFVVQLFEVMNAPKTENLKAPKLTPCGAKLNLRGTMSCRAFVHAKATKSEAVKALKLDAVRSLTSRCELLCEDFLQTEEEQDPKVMYETPLRVFAPLGDSTVQLCDYMFPDETNNDVVDRFKELLNVTIPEDMLETDCEKLPEDSDLDETETNCLEPEETKANFSQAERHGFQITVYIFAGIAVLLAVLITYVYRLDRGS